MSNENRKPISRRDMLKISGFVAGSIAIAGCSAPWDKKLTPTPIPQATRVVTTNIPLPAGIPITEATATIKVETALEKWNNFWPKTANEAATMFGGTASQWQKNPDWTGNRKALSLFYKEDYFPIEWRLTDSNNTFYKWPKSPKEAVESFFPGQKLDPSWMRQNQYGGWELMQDHWKDGYNVDMTATIRPGVVAEGYTVNGDDVAENDRNYVVWGGKNNGINGGLAIPLVNGQGMTIWQPGTDPNKIGIEGKPYNIPYYKGKNGEQLGPNAINFDPIYPTPIK